MKSVFHEVASDVPADGSPDQHCCGSSCHTSRRCGPRLLACSGPAVDGGLPSLDRSLSSERFHSELPQLLLHFSTLPGLPLWPQSWLGGCCSSARCFSGGPYIVFLAFRQGVGLGPALSGGSASVVCGVPFSPRGQPSGGSFGPSCCECVLIDTSIAHHC